MCALSTSARAASGDMPGSEIFSSTSIPKPFGIAPIPTLPSIETSAGRAILSRAGNEFHRTQEAGAVARREQLLRIGAFATGATEFLGRGEFEVQLAVGYDRSPIAATGGFGMGTVENFFN